MLVLCYGMLMSTINERLREARRAAGFMSARSAALHFGWKPSTYAAHENGQNALTAGQARMYSNDFGCSITWLVTGVDNFINDGVIPIVGDISSKDQVNIYAQDHRASSPNEWIDDDLLRSFAVIPFRSRHFHLAFEVRGHLLNPIYQPGDLIVTIGTISKFFKGQHLIAIRKNDPPILGYSDTLDFETDQHDSTAIHGEYYDLNGNVHDGNSITKAIPVEMIIKHRNWMKSAKGGVDWSTSINTFNIQRSEIRQRSE